MTAKQTWTQRLTIASYALHIFALVTAIVTSAIPGGFDSASVLAAVVATIGASVAFVTRIPFPDKSTREVVVLAVSIVCFSVACGLTGGFDSTYTLMPIATIFLAAVGGGMTAAMPTATLAVLGVGAASLTGGTVEITGAVIRIPAFYFLTAIAFSEVRRAVFDQGEIAADARLVADAASSRLQNLQETHDLLEVLVKVATSPDINAVATAQDAIRDVAVIFPSAASRIVARSGTVLAMRGDQPERDADHVLSIAAMDVPAATLSVWTDGDAATEGQLEMMHDALVPVGLAIENDQMVLKVAGLAVQRERVRLARELHDDIAPNVASVGLTLDMLIASSQLDAEQERNLSATRENVSLLVERIRSRVQDLRADRSRSLTDFAHSLVAEVDGDGPTVIVDIDERVPPRPAAAAEIRGVLTEAFRNALHHSAATVIRIHGRTDEIDGTVSVEDNGVGFDPDREPQQRFGLVGMRERGTLVNAEVSIDSEPSKGTIVTIAWRNTL